MNKFISHAHRQSPEHESNPLLAIQVVLGVNGMRERAPLGCPKF